jgi:large subunit ribosomal protein LX
MKAYKVSGSFLMKDRWQNFTKEVAAENPAQAKEVILSDLGSKHRVTRKFVKVEKIVELTPDQLENPVVKWKVGGMK